MSGDELTEVPVTDIRLKPEVSRRLVARSFVGPEYVGRDLVGRDLVGPEVANCRGAGSVISARPAVVPTSVGSLTGPNLVIGESGADWAQGIAAARRGGPNLALLTQWTGEFSAHFAGRVVARLAKRESLSSIVVVCNSDDSAAAITARCKFVVACARLLPDNSTCAMTVLCCATADGKMPSWVNTLVKLAQRSRLALKLELSGIAA